MDVPGFILPQSIEKVCKKRYFDGRNFISAYSEIFLASMYIDMKKFHSGRELISSSVRHKLKRL